MPAGHAESTAHPDLPNRHLRLTRPPDGRRAHHGLRSATLYYLSPFCLFENVHHHKNGKIKELAYEKSFRAKIGTAFLSVQKFAAKFMEYF